MSEEETTVEAGERGPVGSVADARTPDDAAAAFLDLDAELDAGPKAESGADSGLVVDAERVRRERLPDGYPLGARTHGRHRPR